MSHTIYCKNCGKTVAKTPNQTCVSCKIPKWGYTDTELITINSTVKPILTKLVCKNCDTIVAKTPNNQCIKCGMPKWGYNDFELNNGLIKIKPDSLPTVKTTPLSPLPPNNPINTNKVLIAVLAGISIILGLVFIPNIIKKVIATAGNTIGTTENDNILISTDSLSMAIARVEVGGSVGTAFLISPTQLLTAAHVVIDFEQKKVHDEVDVIFTKLGNKKFRAKVVKVGGVWNQIGRSFFLQDFALLEIPKFIEVTPLKLGDSDKVQALAEVMTIGHSQGDATLSFTDGKINSIKYADDSGMADLDLFKHSIPSNPGNSGGPIILKSNSTVIGILVGGRGISTQGSQPNIPQGENIANKISNVKRELDLQN